MPKETPTTLRRECHEFLENFDCINRKATTDKVRVLFDKGCERCILFSLQYLIELACDPEDSALSKLLKLTCPFHPHASRSCSSKKRLFTSPG